MQRFSGYLSASTDGIDCLQNGVVNADVDVVVVIDIHLPRFEPFQINKIADVFFLIFVIDDVPGLKVFD